MSSKIHVALMPPSGNVLYKSADYGSGLSGQVRALSSHHPIVGIWICRDAPGGPFWDQFTENSCYTLKESEEGLTIMPHDTAGQGTTRSKHFLNDGGSESIRTLATKLANAVIGGEGTWDTLDDGTGNDYDDAVIEVRAYLKANFGAPY